MDEMDLNHEPYFRLVNAEKSMRFGWYANQQKISLLMLLFAFFLVQSKKCFPKKDTST